MRNADRPAMPLQVTGHGNDTFSVVSGEYGGLTKREYFAAMAMQGLCASNDYNRLSDIACDSVRLADALLAEFEKE